MNTPALDAWGMTDAGRVRPNNEDHFVVATVRKAVDLQQTSVDGLAGSPLLHGTAANLYVVADGVGGNRGGEVASGFAVQAIAEYLGQAAQCFQATDVEAEHAFLEELEQAVHTAHARLRTAHGERGKPPATTLTLVTLLWPRAYLVHVGDSRAYYLRRGLLKQLTRDQTMAEALLDHGAITEEQARTSRAKDILVSAVGGSELMPSVGLVDLEAGDVLLLCSDGLTKHVDDATITELLGRAPTAEAACRTLVDRALDGGGSDNVTVVVVRVPAA